MAQNRNRNTRSYERFCNVTDCRFAQTKWFQHTHMVLTRSVNSVSVCLLPSSTHGVKPGQLAALPGDCDIIPARLRALACAQSVSGTMSLRALSLLPLLALSSVARAAHPHLLQGRPFQALPHRALYARQIPDQFAYQGSLYQHNPLAVQQQYPFTNYDAQFAQYPYVSFS